MVIVDNELDDPHQTSPLSKACLKNLGTSTFVATTS